jgi:hypothetical protein
MADRYAIPQYVLEREAAKRSDRIVQVVCLALAGLCFGGAAWLLGPINEARTKHQLIVDPERLQGVPPDIVLLSKMGTFRALAIDMAFIRAETLKNEDKFFELMQLSSWLCKLAPYYPTIWSFAAWNQAYNISVSQYTPEARWNWVNNGIRLLRDEGIPYNNKSITLYKELAWIYWHKIGDLTDDHNFAYKRELAVEMERVLGAPPLTLTEQEALDAFRVIADAPRDVDRLLREDREVAALVGRLRDVGLEADGSLLDFVARYLRNDIQIANLLKIDPNDAGQRRLLERTRVLTDPANVAARDRLLATLRAHVLETRYHMDPRYMLELMQTYGPLDWRLPYAYSLYWSSLGDKRTKGLIALDPSDSMNTVRLIFFSLDNMVRRGRLVLEPNWDQPNRSYLQMLPDVRFVRHTHRAYLKYGKEQIEDPKLNTDYVILNNYRAGHVNFLRAAVQELWLLGTPDSRAEAAEYYAWLRENDREPDGSAKAYYMQPIEGAVMQTIYDSLTSFRNAEALVNAFLQRSLDQLGIGDLRAAQGYFDVAQQSWNYYMADKLQDLEDRRRMRPLPEMRRRAALTYLQAPEAEVSLIQKVRVWRNLDLETRQFCYDATLPYMTRLCAEHAPPLDLEAVFREPPGMADYREQARTAPASTEPAIEAGEKAPK